MSHFSSVLRYYSYILVDSASKWLLLTGKWFCFPCSSSNSQESWCVHRKRKLTRALFYFQQVTETTSPSAFHPSALSLDLLNNAVTAFSTLEELIRYLEPDRWQMDLDSLYKPSRQVVGKAYLYGKRTKGKRSLQVRASFDSLSGWCF